MKASLYPIVVLNRYAAVEFVGEGKIVFFL